MSSFRCTKFKDIRGLFQLAQAQGHFVTLISPVSDRKRAWRWLRNSWTSRATFGLNPGPNRK